MSREIKFRAWNGHTMLKHGDDPECDDDEICAHEWVRFCCELDLIQKSHKLMQYTGLKDKNGVEIYEGDIVEGYDHDDSVAMSANPITFVNGAFCYQYSNKSTNPLSRISRAWLVIGNIYENPELMEK